MSAARITYSVSCRGKTAAEPVGRFLSSHFTDLADADIDTVFGFVERSTLYGGRAFAEPELSDADVTELRRRGIGLKLPLSNHFISDREYEDNLPLLEKYHEQGNAVVVVNDKLAGRLRADFPRYSIEASVIKDIRTHDEVARALEIYDTVVLPMHLNTNLAFLEAVPAKNRIRLFANGGCAYNCPLKLCYVSFSKMNKYTGEAEFKCSQPLLARPQLGMLDFDVKRFVEMGFTRFKLLRSKGLTGY